MRINNSISINVLVRDRPVQEYQSRDFETFIEGRPGSAYSIEIKNHLGQRVEAIVSVDGLSVIDGKPAGDGSSGYLLEAHQSLIIPGWKVDSAKAAAFVFGAREASYATEIGGGQNNGVIGVKAFAEKHRAPVFRGIVSKGANSPFDRSAWYGSGYDSATLSGSSATLTSNQAATAAAQAATAATQAVNNLGTGWGDAQSFHTTEVSFERGDLAGLGVIYYDDARGLKARGIEVGRRSVTSRTATRPSAFPGDVGCKPPVGWKG